ncbi:alpha/beta fold hydrolase [Antarctobacter heliothermus]|uniref:Pimeloyl-ACP methyl ester carboxylesterase n=1 Tax=Antarctobacter heliothermus TaxID=74033 RepID=A0A239BJ59_9RHOB|nr:alpha/beta hydrolase [Antarctobacter heliothermus]SNS07669.1 Pimeloyl-ACP methyl ester carboxylesterase [Antarctobacter heliothermus]
MRDHSAGSDLNWRTWGNGPAQVLALHCGLGQGGMWRAAAAPLLDRCTVRAPDLPGHGKSPPFPVGEDVHDAACATVRPHLTDGIHLVGHSFGATLALRLALGSPARIASLTLIEPVFFAAAADSALKRDHKAAEDALYAECEAGNLRQGARLFNRLWGGGVPWDSFPDKVQQAMARQMPFVCATEPALWQDRAGMLAKGGLERITCPVSLLRGSQTVPIIAEVHKGLMDRLPLARETVVEGAGHMVLLSHPQAVTQALAKALTDPNASSL